MSRFRYQRNFSRISTRLIKSLLKRIRLICILLLASLLLSGCVDYDLGVNINNANYGKFVQHIKLGEKLTSFSGDAVYEWLDSIERRARELDGKAKRISQEEVFVTSYGCTYPSSCSVVACCLTTKDFAWVGKKKCCSKEASLLLTDNTPGFVH